MKKFFGSKSRHLSADLAIVAADIERIDRADAADATFQLVPKGDEVVAHRRDDSKPGDNDSSIFHDVMAKAG